MAVRCWQSLLKVLLYLSILKINHASFLLFLCLQLSADTALGAFCLLACSCVMVVGSWCRNIQLLLWPGEEINFESISYNNCAFAISIPAPISLLLPKSTRDETGRSTGHVSFGTVSDFCSFLKKNQFQDLSTKLMEAAVSLHREMECIRASDTVHCASWVREWLQPRRLSSSSMENSLTHQCFDLKNLIFFSAL